MTNTQKCPFTQYCTKLYEYTNQVHVQDKMYKMAIFPLPKKSVVTYSIESLKSYTYSIFYNLEENLSKIFLITTMYNSIYISTRFICSICSYHFNQW